MISQVVLQAGIGDWHFEMICLLLQAIKLSDHFGGVAPCAARAPQFVLQKP
jgi:hypothetical protein